MEKSFFSTFASVFQSFATPRGMARWHGFTPLMVAAHANDDAKVGRLIASDVELDAVDDVGGITALGRAAIHKDPASLILLLAAGADSSASAPGRAGTKNGPTPLIIAARFKSVRCLGLLIDAGAELGTVDAHGSSALSNAVLAGSAACCKLLVKRGAPLPFGAEAAALVALATKPAQLKALQCMRMEHAAREARELASVAKKAGSPKGPSRRI